MPDFMAMRRDAEEYRDLYRELAGLSGADYARSYTYAKAREAFTREQLLTSLRAIRADGFGANIALDGTLTQSMVQKGLLLAKNPPIAKGEKRYVAPDYTLRD